MTCSVHCCDRPARARGLCNAHYGRLLRQGDVLPDVPVRLREDQCHTCAEADFMRDFGGGSPQELAEALGVQARSLMRDFLRHNRPDLAAWVREATNAEYRTYRRQLRERQHATD